jgi:hypothetical protein
MAHSGGDGMARGRKAPICGGERVNGNETRRVVAGNERVYRRGNSPAGWRSALALNPKIRKGLKCFACPAKRTSST